MLPTWPVGQPAPPLLQEGENAPATLVVLFPSVRGPREDRNPVLGRSRNVIELELPYPPSVNHYYRHVGPRMLISREGRLYRERVQAELAASEIQPLPGQLAIRIELYPPDRRRRDADNAMKALLDSLQHGGAYLDDTQIVNLQVRKLAPMPGGKVIVRLEAL